jgi:proton-dependent oligopeptide transporter, POT family
MNDQHSEIESATLFGHPTGLFTLFFAEMWERFSYYGMRALLVFYMIKGFLGYTDNDAYGVYGAYTALVYATPFIGGMLADRLLGARRAVILGGLLMAAGHLAMTIENETIFFIALALLICGNGFFKPNISTIVGGLYSKGSTKKDTGFTIFYMGINLGAAMSPVICGYVGETYGWHYGFGLATAGMLAGVAVFVAPTRITQLLILGGAMATAISMPFLQDSLLQLGVRLLLSLSLAVGGVIAFSALGRGGLPDAAGRAPSEDRLNQLAIPALREKAVPYSVCVVLAAVGGLLALNQLTTPSAIETWSIGCAAVAALVLPWVSARNAVFVGIAGLIPVIALLVQRSEAAGWMLTAFGILAFGSLIVEAARSTRIERERMYVVLILMFFSMLFWAFFEQAGSSVNNFTDRNIDRVFEERVVAETEVGSTLTFRVASNETDPAIAALPLLTQEQLGYPCDDAISERVRELQKEATPDDSTDADHASANPESTESGATSQTLLTMTHVSVLRDEASKENVAAEDKTISWTVTEQHVGMAVGGAEVPASEFQAANPIFILLFGLVFSAIWSFLDTHRLEPSTPVKFSLGLLQLGLAFGAFWYGAHTADERGMVTMFWLLLGYLLQTTGELCLSPVGLAMVTKLSPTRIVSTVMGAWFLATAFSNYLAGIIATFTGVSHGGNGDNMIPPPQETVNVYGDVFYTIALTAIGSAVICFALSPLLSRWMHADVTEDELAEAAED